MAITTKQQRQQRQQRRSEALQLIADGVPPTDAATQLSQTWGCSRRTSLRDIEIAQSELANALNSVQIQHMVGWRRNINAWRPKLNGTASTQQPAEPSIL